MTDLLKTALALVPSLLPTRRVTYQRGDSSLLLDVTKGSSQVYYQDENGIRQRALSIDYIIVHPEKLILDGSVTLPEEGDKIIDDGEGTSKTFQVLQGDMAEAWRYTDRYETMIRVHTKQVDEE